MEKRGEEHREKVEPEAVTMLDNPTVQKKLGKQEKNQELDEITGREAPGPFLPNSKLMFKRITSKRAKFVDWSIH